MSISLESKENNDTFKRCRIKQRKKKKDARGWKFNQKKTQSKKREIRLARKREKTVRKKN